MNRTTQRPKTNYFVFQFVRLNAYEKSDASVVFVVSRRPLPFVWVILFILRIASVASYNDYRICRIHLGHGVSPLAVSERYHRGTRVLSLGTFCVILLDMSFFVFFYFYFYSPISRKPVCTF